MLKKQIPYRDCINQSTEKEMHAKTGSILSLSF